MSIDLASLLSPDHDNFMIDVEPLDDIEEQYIEEIHVEEELESEKPSNQETFEPYVGMEFQNKEDAYKLYNTYAYINGFSIRIGTSNKNTKDVVYSIRLVCSKQGFKPSQKHQVEEPMLMDNVSHEKTPQKEVGDKRCGCKAAVQLRLYEGEIWRITSFYKEHKHALVKNTPSKKRNLRSHKKISEEEKVEIQLLSEQNISTSKMREFLAAKKGGRQHLHYKKKDISNQVSRENKNLVGVDVDSMLNYFLKKRKVDPEFFFSIEPDEDNAAKNIFWVDGRSRRAYQAFGDVVTFDTTYNTNRYSMPVGPFLGVSPHRHTIYFGCSMIRDEKKTTFGWLFRTWLEAMDGKHPKAIITDQDPAMKAAIAEVFPNTIHRCCQWHVMRNARDHLGVLYGAIDGFKDELVAVIDYSLTITDFEKNWKGMLKNYHLEDNSYLNVMFDKRDQWVPCYFRETFFANMSTSQRSESMNAAMKIWMSCNTSLYKFAVQFDKLLQGVYERESDEDIRTMNETPQTVSCDPIEAEGRDVYTRNVFLIFKEKVRRSTAYRVREVEKDRWYEVRPAKTLIRYDWYNPTRKVYVDKEKARADCDCKGFEFQGLLCPHSIAVMRHVEMEPFLPVHYVLKRWTRDANTSVKRPATDRENEEDLKNVMLSTLTQDMQRVAIEAVKSRAAYDKACARIKELDEEVTEINQSMGTMFVSPDCNATCTTHAGGVRKSLQYHDPPISQCKGRSKVQRLKPPSEIKIAKKMRTCGYCGKKEGHNKQTCPKKPTNVNGKEGQYDDLENNGNDGM